jgi:hypothetical protein
MRFEITRVFALLGLAVMAASVPIGCEPTVTYLGNDCDGKECPATCPSTVVEGGSCSTDGQACTLPTDDGCQQSWYCGVVPGQPPGRPGAEGPASIWQYTGTVCPTQPVPCLEAHDGDACPVVGETCSYSDECSGMEAVCTGNGTWQLSYWDDECCYDECCYDECCGYYGAECPSAIPTQGEWCDPCEYSEPCSFEVETECGPQAVDAWCSYDDFSWFVSDPAPCP